MSVKTVFMFSGQGGHYYQMGRQLYEENQVFRDCLIRLDKVAHSHGGRSIVDAIYSGRKSEIFSQTLLTHPAIFMLEYSLADTLLQAGVRPDLVLGASMGSFAAAAVAGHIEAEEALQCVFEQALAFQACCDPGGMLAVLAEPSLYDEPFMHQRSEMAGINFDTSFSIAGSDADLDAIASDLDQMGTASQRLAVSFAFHASGIDGARDRFGMFMRSVGRRKGRLPLACCAEGAVLDDLPEDFFWQVVRRPIRFQETIRHLERHGAHRYIDLGPSGTLATFLKYGLAATSHSSVHAIMTPFGRDSEQLAAVLAAS